MKVAGEEPREDSAFRVRDLTIPVEPALFALLEGDADTDGLAGVHGEIDRFLIDGEGFDFGRIGMRDGFAVDGGAGEAGYFS